MFGSYGNAGASNTNSGSAFGGVGQTSTQPTGGFGAFNQAQQPAQQPATSGFGSFNQAQQPQTQPQPQPQAQAQNTGLFGGGSAFATQNKPLGGFGMSYHLSMYHWLTLTQAVPAALERVPTLDLLVFLDRPILRSSNNLLLPICLGKISQLVVHLAGAHLVCATQLSACCS